MNVHQYKSGTIVLGENEYKYEYWERDWYAPEGHDFELYPYPDGNCHELVLTNANWRVDFADGTRLSVATVVGGQSFEECLERIKNCYLMYEIAKVSSSLPEAREAWYIKLEEKS